jgi:hypothetical protein
VRGYVIATWLESFWRNTIEQKLWLNGAAPYGTWKVGKSIGDCRLVKMGVIADSERKVPTCPSTSAVVTTI